MAKVWQLQEAKNKFSQVVDSAQDEGPQVVTRWGREVAVVLSYEAYRTLTVPSTSLASFFLNSPLPDSGLDLSRDASLPRDEFVP